MSSQITTATPESLYLVVLPKGPLPQPKFFSKDVPDPIWGAWTLATTFVTPELLAKRATLGGLRLVKNGAESPKAFTLFRGEIPQGVDWYKDIVKRVNQCCNLDPA